MKYNLPKHFNHNHIDKFLDKFGHLFFEKHQLKPNVTLDGSNVSQISVVGILLLYKLMEFTVNNSCFNNPKFRSNEDIEESIEKYGFTELMNALVHGGISEKKRKKIYSNINVKIQQNFIIAPHTMERDNSFSNEKFQKNYVSKIADYYGDNKVSQMIFTCISEILLNFWKHAEDDPFSILVAEGNKNKIEIACADTGNGIIKTLRESLKELNNWDDTEVLLHALKKNVTSKPNTFHMGRGLWILNEISKMTNGIFHIYSQGASVKTRNGECIAEKCGYWDGTFVYINLPLNNPVTMDDVLKEEIELLDTIQLNII